MPPRDWTAAATVTEAVSGAAHSLQYFAPGWLLAPQRAHFTIIDEAHSLQNFAP
jgi:hypothetical protein